MKQATFGEYAENTPDFPGVSRDEWGPKAHHPVPEAEQHWLRRGPAIDKRELKGTGLAPSDFEIVNGVCSPQTVREKGYHPDDARPRHGQRKAEREEHERAMAVLAVSRTMDRIHNGARSTTRAVDRANSNNTDGSESQDVELVTDGGSDTETDSEPPSKEELESSIEKEVREKHEAKALTGEEWDAAVREHRHHLVRDTRSRKTLRQELGPHAESVTNIEVPDTYCFTCEEWVGLSGVELTGTPRSKADAYYLGGPPDAIRDCRHLVRRAVADLAKAVIERHPEIDAPDTAAGFITDEIEQISGDLVLSAESDRGPD